MAKIGAIPQAVAVPNAKTIDASTPNYHTGAARRSPIPTKETTMQRQRSRWRVAKMTAAFDQMLAKQAMPSPTPQGERMRERATLPEDVRFVANGTDGGRTWTRYTDGGHDYEVVYDPETKEEHVHMIANEEDN
jgi:hypothetical protein